MKKIKGMKYYFIAAAIALLAVFVAAPAGARDLNWMLRGDYDYSLVGTCARASCGGGGYDCVNEPGFNPETLAPTGDYYSDNYSIRGKINFDGHGGYTSNAGGLNIRFSPKPDPVIPFTLDCSGTYIIYSQDNELFVDMTYDSCISKVTSGAFAGITQEYSNSFIMRGRLDTDTGSGVVMTSTTVPSIEEIEVIAPAIPGVVGTKVQRICNNMGNMVKLSGPNH
jgi:hypothetical protein